MLSGYPYKSSQILRATVDRNVRCVLPKLEDAPEGSYRMVQILTPETIFIAFETTLTWDDKDGKYISIPTQAEGTAGGRDYLMARVPDDVGVIAPFAMLPEQELYMMAASRPGVDHSSLAFATIIVQHWRTATGGTP